MDDNGTLLLILCGASAIVAICGVIIISMLGNAASGKFSNED